MHAFFVRIYNTDHEQYVLQWFLWDKGSMCDYGVLHQSV